jgi:hypothetical protein
MGLMRYAVANTSYVYFQKSKRIPSRLKFGEVQVIQCAISGK